MSKQLLEWWHWLLAAGGLFILGVLAGRFAIFHPEGRFAFLLLAIVVWTLASASLAMAVVRFMKSAWSYFASRRPKQIKS